MEYTIKITPPRGYFEDINSLDLHALCASSMASVFLGCCVLCSTVLQTLLLLPLGINLTVLCFCCWSLWREGSFYSDLLPLIWPCRFVHGSIHFHGISILHQQAFHFWRDPLVPCHLIFCTLLHANIQLNSAYKYIPVPPASLPLWGYTQIGYFSMRAPAHVCVL